MIRRPWVAGRKKKKKRKKKGKKSAKHPGILRRAQGAIFQGQALACGFCFSDNVADITGLDASQSPPAPFNPGGGGGGRTSLSRREKHGDPANATRLGKAPFDGRGGTIPFASWAASRRPGGPKNKNSGSGLQFRPTARGRVGPTEFRRPFPLLDGTPIINRLLY